MRWIRVDKAIPSKELTVLLLCLSILISLAPHIGFLENKFIDGEDLQHVVQNPLIRNVTFTGMAHDITGFFHYGYPSFLLSYFWGLIFSFWGLNHIGFHLSSIFLHILCTGLLFLLLFRKSRRNGLSFFCTLIFAAHPLHVESITWISRQDVLLFVLLAILYLHLSFQDSAIFRALRLGALLIAGLIFPLSPLLAGGGYLLHLSRSKKSVTFIEEGGITLVWVLVIWWGHMDQWVFHGFFVQAPTAILWLLEDFFLPWRIHFMLPLLPSHVSGALFLAYLFISGSLLLFFKTKKDVWGFVFLSLLSVWLFHVPSDRFNGGWAYFSLLWIALALGTGLDAVRFHKDHSSTLLVVGLLILFSFLSGISVHREKEWKNTESLLSDSLKSSPTDPLLLALMGHYRAAMGNTNDMKTAFSRIKKEEATTLCLEAKSYHLAMQFSQSPRLFTRLFHMYPMKRKDKFCLFDFAVLKIQQGDFKRAKRLLTQITKMDPFFIYAWHNLGTLLLKEKREEGTGDLKRVLEIAPAYHPTLENLAFFFMRQGKWDRVIHFLNMAVKTTSCQSTLKYYREWIRAAEERKNFPYASLQWAKLTPPS